MRLLLDSEQLRVLNWRTNTSDIAALEGPPGCGKTTVGSALAIKLIAEGIAKRVLLVAYTNAAANEFGWELFRILGPSAANICIRTGNPTGVDPTLPIPFSRSIDIILKKKIVISTNLSLKRLPTMKFDNMIIDEAGVERIEHLLWPLWFGVDIRAQAAQRNQDNSSAQIKDLMGINIKMRYSCHGIWRSKTISTSFFHWLEIIRREMLEQLGHYRISMW